MKSAEVIVILLDASDIITTSGITINESLLVADNSLNIGDTLSNSVALSESAYSDSKFVIPINGIDVTVTGAELTSQVNAGSLDASVVAGNYIQISNSSTGSTTYMKITQ